MLPKNYPDKINCYDKNKIKQGYWIEYDLKFNPEEEPGILKQGDYVESYSFGRYVDNKKVGTWKTIENIHLVYEQRKDSFYYAKDSIIVISEFSDGGFKKSNLFLNADSTIIIYKEGYLDDNFLMTISCNKNRIMSKQCVLSYREYIFKYFPFNEIEQERFGLANRFIGQRKEMDIMKNGSK